MAENKKVDETKLKTLIAYFAEKTHPGKVKLFKLLYLADFTAHVEIGHSITGEVYENYPLGPVPAFLRKNFDAVVNDCVNIERVNIGMRHPEINMTSRGSTDCSVFDAAEMRVIDDIVARYGNWNGARLSELTHKELPYRVTNAGDEIPYHLAGFRNFKKMTNEDVRKLLASGLAERVGRVAN
jgi:uncharacterized phage-associated protein